ncbi:MAG: carbon-nitrogen hydrolase family protein [Methanosarcinales archaeon]|nr:carbon-nitrogen hydrolase family protein [Methanosarcinales archaeon]
MSIVQTNYDPLDVEKLKHLIENLDGIVCFPECFALGRSGTETLKYLNKVSGEASNIVEEMKGTGKTMLLPLIEKHGVMRNRFYNTTYMIHEGKVIGSYRRVVIHPMEKSFVQKGKVFPVFDIDDVSIGLLICFEIAFPELTRIIALKGASIIFVPSSTPEEADYIWEKRLVSRAIDNQLFIVGVNRCGGVGNEEFIGKSMVVSPCGELLHKCGNSEEIISVEIDLDEVTRERGREPTFSEFEIDVYDNMFMEFFKNE